MLITRVSMATGALNVRDIPVTQEQLNRWGAGELIQRVCPNLLPWQREFIMTGITEEEWELHIEPTEDDEHEC